MKVTAASHQAVNRLSQEQIEEFGRELDALRAEVMGTLGKRDAAYIRRILGVRRSAELAGRLLLWIGFLPPAWLAGTALLSLSKILENMEIGHNVMHGQWDWLNDPKLNSRTYEWDSVCPSEQWRHSHNYIHHTYTNVMKLDRDLGYGILRVNRERPWHPVFLFQPVYNWILALLFEWGVALHDVEFENIGKTKSKDEAKAQLRQIVRKARRQVLKDYLLFPALAGPFFLYTLAGNFTANLIRNLWAYMIIFCGHFTEGVAVFRKEDLDNETRGQWYLRQLLGSSNLEGGRAFPSWPGPPFRHMPSHRYSEIAPRVRALCAKYGLPYNSGSLWRQFGSVIKRIHRYALPPRPMSAESSVRAH